MFQWHSLQLNFNKYHTFMHDGGLDVPPGVVGGQHHRFEEDIAGARLRGRRPRELLTRRLERGARVRQADLGGAHLLEARRRRCAEGAER